MIRFSVQPMRAMTPTELNERRKALRISHRALAARAGLSEPTVKRMLGGSMERASMANVVALLGALGYEIDVRAAKPVEQIRREAARDKAVLMVARVQATSALEAQAVGPDGVERLHQRAERMLLEGSPRRLWE